MAFSPTLKPFHNLCTFPLSFQLARQRAPALSNVLIALPP